MLPAPDESPSAAHARRPPALPPALPPKRVLLTGATGFIGQQVVPGLLARGYEVEAVTSRAQPRGWDGVRLHRADLLEPEERRRVVAEAQAPFLVHLAWCVTPGQAWTSPENIRWVEASLGLLRDFAAVGGRRAVLAGSCSEYGTAGGLCDEGQTPAAPSNLYGVCKDAVRAVALNGSVQLGLSLAWARIFFAYGPGEHPVRLVASIANNLLRNRPAPCSHARQVRDYLFTPEIAAALIAVLESDLTGAVNIGSGKPVSLSELILKIAQSIGRPDLVRFGEVIPPPDDPPVLVASTKRLNDEVGWMPSISLDEGLERTIDWWRSQMEGESAEGGRPILG